MRFFKPLVAFILTFIISSTIAKGAKNNSDAKIPLYDWYEFEIVVETTGANPYLDEGLSGKFISPSGETLLIDGFYDGDNNWKLRFSPTEPGKWQYELKGLSFAYIRKGTITCIRSENQGFIRIHSDNKYAFAYQSGQSFFP